MKNQLQRFQDFLRYDKLGKIKIENLLGEGGFDISFENDDEFNYESDLSEFIINFYDEFSQYLPDYYNVEFFLENNQIKYYSDGKNDITFWDKETEEEIFDKLKNDFKNILFKEYYLNLDISGEFDGNGSIFESVIKNFSIENLENNELIEGDKLDGYKPLIQKIVNNIVSDYFDGELAPDSYFLSLNLSDNDFYERKISFEVYKDFPGDDFLEYLNSIEI